MSLAVLSVPVAGAFAENTYFVVDERARRGVLIDPGAEPRRLLDFIYRNGLTIDRILLTHGHIDHIGAVNELREALEAEAWSLSDRYLLNPVLNLSAAVGDPYTVSGARHFQDGDMIQVAEGSDLEVICTPGHTPDSVIFYCRPESFAIAGDTVYQGGPGLTTFPGGDDQVLRKTYHEKILTLPRDTVIYTGHARPIRASDLRH